MFYACCKTNILTAFTNFEYSLKKIPIFLFKCFLKIADSNISNEFNYEMTRIKQI